MLAPFRSYTFLKAKIQWAGCAIVSLGIGLTGCSQISVPVGSADVDTPLVLTGSLPSASDVALADIEESDRTAILGTLSKLLEAPSADSSLALSETPLPTSYSWSNVETGNSGSISDLDRTFISETGCIGFNTTANTIAGVRLYAGTACLDGRQKLVITNLTVSAA